MSRNSISGQIPTSPSLSDMEFDFSDGAHHPDAPRHAVGSHNHHGQGAQIELPKRLTRYLPADSRDAFIGPLLSSTAVRASSYTLVPTLAVWLAQSAGVTAGSRARGSADRRKLCV